MSLLLNFLLGVVVVALGIGAGAFLVVSPLIVLFFGIPLTLRLKAAGHLTSTTPLWRYCFSFVLLISSFAAVSWAVLHFLPQYVIPFAVGAGMALVSGVSKLGANPANMADYLESNGRYLRPEAYQSLGLAPTTIEADSPPLHSTVDWTPYESSREKFSARFPGVVKRQFIGSGKDDGVSPASIVHSCQTPDGALYEVRVTRIIHVFGLPTEFLKLVMKELVSAISAAHIVRESPAVLLGCPAVEFVMRVREVSEVRGVTLVLGNTVYIVSVLNPPGGSHDFLPFWGEFRLVNTGPDAAEEPPDGKAAFTSERERFSTHFPGRVERQFLGSGADDGKSPATIIFSSLTNDGALYEVRVLRSEDVSVGPLDLIGQVQDEIMERFGVENLVKESPEVFFGCIAASYEMNCAGVSYLRGISLVRGNTAYTVSLLNPPSGGHSFSSFWNEFRLAAQ